MTNIDALSPEARAEGLIAAARKYMDDYYTQWAGAPHELSPPHTLVQRLADALAEAKKRLDYIEKEGGCVFFDEDQPVWVFGALCRGILGGTSVACRGLTDATDAALAESERVSVHICVQEDATPDRNETVTEPAEAVAPKTQDDA
jgi:hypothetical protein